MFQRFKINKRLFIIFVAALLLLFVIFLLIFTRSKNYPIQLIPDEPVELDSTQQTILDNEAEQNIWLEDINDFELYFDIASSPNEKVIRRSYDTSTVKIKTLAINKPKAQGTCNIDIFKIEGVSANKVKGLFFNLSPDADIQDGDFSLGGGLYRVDITCNFGESVYYKVYTLDLQMEGDIPASFPI